MYISQFVAHFEYLNIGLYYFGCVWNCGIIKFFDKVWKFDGLIISAKGRHYGIMALWY